MECRSPIALTAASEVLRWQNHLLTWITQLQASTLESALSLPRKEHTSMEQALPKQVANSNFADRQRTKNEETFSKMSSAT